MLKTLEGMESGRRAWRLVGDVLVERTVGEVGPAVKKHRWGEAHVSHRMPLVRPAHGARMLMLLHRFRDNLESVLKALELSLKQQETELAEFQVRRTDEPTAAAREASMQRNVCIYVLPLAG